AVDKLLAESGLIFEGTPDLTALAEDSEDNIVATASLSGSVIKMVAADPAQRESGVSASLISALMQAAREDNIYHFFIYTKPETADRFAGLGFKELAAARDAVLLECGVPSVEDYRRLLFAERDENGSPAAAAVMNCNPFTLGHRYLIEKAASESRFFYVIVVEEEASAFPFEDRVALVRSGTADLANVRVIPSSHYAVSAATFPSYFLKDRAESAVARTQAELDARLFASLYVPSLGVTKRYVGTEPLSPVTELYNSVLKEILPPLGCEVVETERLRSDGEVISASRVRAAIASGDEESLPELLPRVTLDYLNTPRGRTAAAKLRESE
ncbi:MAG: [citrate (pro-3S)-lyase] ligase, partial [Synergistes sp.]|nr:[citrate (pro-3S)-lyase] ligase [Synergistes sp.]